MLNHFVSPGALILGKGGTETMVCMVFSVASAMGTGVRAPESRSADE